MSYLLSPKMLLPLTVDKAGSIFVSSNITSTIEGVVKTPASEVRSQITKLKEIYDTQKNNTRISVNYDDPAVLDAYAVNYLPRNTLIPKLGLLCCSYVPKTLVVPGRLRILDIGSGTGAIPLGLLDLFQSPSLSQTKCDIYAIDSSVSSLSKQRKLIERFGLNGSTHDWDYADLSDPDTYKPLLPHKGPFDLIFSANVLSELKREHIDHVLSLISDNLKQDGVCVMVESQNTPAKRACAYLSHHIAEYGLRIFFPCPPPVDCQRTTCWGWFNHEFDCDDITVGKERFEVTKKHTVLWMILTKRALSIYDYLNSQKSGLEWGITRPDNRNGGNEFCSEIEQFNGKVEPGLPWAGSIDPWSHIVGMSDECRRIQSTWSPVRGFSACDCKVEKN